MHSESYKMADGKWGYAIYDYAVSDSFPIITGGDCDTRAQANKLARRAIELEMESPR